MRRLSPSITSPNVHALGRRYRKQVENDATLSGCSRAAAPVHPDERRSGRTGSPSPSFWRIRRLTPSVRNVAVLVGHPDLLQRVLGELPRVTLKQKLLVVQHPGSRVVAVSLPITHGDGGLHLC